MRNGFRSSRGAIRGIIGGTVGLATVAIGCRSFLLRWVVRVRFYSFTWPQKPKTCVSTVLKVARGSELGVCRQFLFGTCVLVPASDGAEVQCLSTLAQRNSKRLGHMNSTNRVAHQSPCGPSRF